MKLLIPISYINTSCALSVNIDDKKMIANLEEAQEDLKDVLGPEFYEEIESQYAPVNDTLNPDNTILYDNYIKKFLAWQSYLYSLGFSQSASTPTGEREFNDENSSILQDVKLYSKEKNIKRRASKYKDQIINFLRLSRDKDSTKYPKWKNRCFEEMSWGISSVSANSDVNFKINKTTILNE